MFDFKEELTKYRKSLETGDLTGGVSGDEVRDILDIAKELMNARAAGLDQPAVQAAPAGRYADPSEETAETSPEDRTAGETSSDEETPDEETADRKMASAVSEETGTASETSENDQTEEKRSSEHPAEASAGEVR